MRKSQRARLSKALLAERDVLLASWKEAAGSIPKLGSERGKIVLALLFTEMDGFLDAFLGSIVTRDRETYRPALRNMAGILFRADLPHSILAHVQIWLKRVLIKQVISAFEGRKNDIRTMCDFLEAEIDRDRIFVADEFERLAHRSLEESEKNYRELIEEMEDLVFRLDPEGLITFTNSACERILGLSSDSIIGRDFLSYIDTSSAKEVRRNIGETLRLQSAREFLCELRPRNGEQVILNVRVYPALSEDGSIAELKGIARDISETKHLEVELKKKVFEIRTQLEVGKTVSTIIDVDELLDRAIEFLCERFRYPGCTIYLYDADRNVLRRAAGRGTGGGSVKKSRYGVGEGIPGWVAREQEILFIPDVEKHPHYAEESEGIGSEIVIPLLSGKKLVGVIEVMSPERDAFRKEDMIKLSLFATQVASAVSSARLFEELRKTNEELGRTNLLLDYRAMELRTSRRILEGISRRLEPESIIRAVSLPLKELIPFTSIALFIAGSSKNVLIMDGESSDASGGSAVDAKEIVSHLKRTKTIPHEVLGRSLEQYAFGKAGQGAEGEPWRGVSICCPLLGEDEVFGALYIGDHRREGFHEEEEAFVKNVTSQISLGLSRLFSIREYQNRIEEISRMKTDFSSLISHELRTPVTSLKNSIDILLSEKTGTLGEKQKQLLSLAKKESRRLCELIDAVLELSKLEAGTTVMNRRQLEVRSLLDAAFERVRDLAKENNVTLTKRVSRTLPRIFADPERLDAMLNNLLTNAIRFSRSGTKVQVSVSLVEEIVERLPHTRRVPAGWRASSVICAGNGNGKGNTADPEERAGPFIEFAVKDRGPGISQDRLDMIFDKFTQVDPVMTRSVSGIGLGLTITKHLTTAHGGMLWVESKEGEGSIFRCLLPVHRGEDPVESGFSCSRQEGSTNSGLGQA